MFLLSCSIAFILTLSPVFVFAESENLVLHFDSRPSLAQIKMLQNAPGVESVTRFTPYRDIYFDKLVSLSVRAGTSKQTLKYLGSQKSIVKAEQARRVDLQAINVTNPSRITNDRFLPWQWALDNTGQKITSDITDIKQRTVTGKVNFDIGWKNIRHKLKQQLKREISVAVIDSGVDVEHPDFRTCDSAGDPNKPCLMKDRGFKTTILTNPSECRQDEVIPASGKVKDLDGNGYAGDCLGWNFTGRSGGNNKVYDNIGHGTHVSGSISALTGNSLGLAAVSEKVKVLPIKVSRRSNNDRRFVRDEYYSTFTDHVAKAILYAVSRKVDVINMSLGWPKSLDTEYLRKAVKIALNKGITIVAASGNNNNPYPIFPCSHKGVICVGSVSADGVTSEFSNYGGTVDILAPGDNILSALPTKMDPEHFAHEGYDIKSGTSQSAPIVSLLAALIKGLQPRISEHHLKARIYSSAVDVDQKGKFSLFGAVNFKKALFSPLPEIAQPIFKDPTSVVYAGRNAAFSFVLPVVNLGTSSNYRISVKSLSNNFVINSGSQSLSLSSGQQKQVTVKGSIRRLDANNIMKYQVTLKSKAFSRSFINQIYVSRSVVGDPAVISFRLGRQNKDLTSLRTVGDRHRLSKYPDYYHITETKNDKRRTVAINLKLFSYSGSNSYGAKEINFEGAEQLLSVDTFDLNFDGRRDILVRILRSVDGERFVEYRGYDLNLRSLHGYGNWMFSPTYVLLSQNHRVLPTKVAGKSVATFFFVEANKVPDKDQHPDPFEPRDTSTRNHIYYFKPEIVDGEQQMITRIVDNHKFREALLKKIKVSWRNEIEILTAMPQGRKERQAGVAQFLFSFGEPGRQLRYAVLSLKSPDNWSVSHLDNGKVFFYENATFKSLISLDEGHLGDLNAGVVASNTSKRSKMTWSSLWADGRGHSGGEVRQTDASDQVHSVMHAYKKRDTSFLFYQSLDHINLLVKKRGRKELYQTPITRFSFLPGKVFSELFHPIVYNKSGDLHPAYYVDATRLNTDHIYTMVSSGEALYSPVSLSIKVPKNCQTMNPVPLGTKMTFHMTLLCAEQGQWRLQFIPVQ